MTSCSYPPEGLLADCSALLGTARFCFTPPEGRQSKTDLTQLGWTAVQESSHSRRRDRTVGGVAFVAGRAGDREKL